MIIFAIIMIMNILKQSPERLCIVQTSRVNLVKLNPHVRRLRNLQLFIIVVDNQVKINIVVIVVTFPPFSGSTDSLKIS